MFSLLDLASGKKQCLWMNAAYENWSGKDQCAADNANDCAVYERSQVQGKVTRCTETLTVDGELKVLYHIYRPVRVTLQSCLRSEASPTASLSSRANSSASTQSGMGKEVVATLLLRQTIRTQAVVGMERRQQLERSVQDLEVSLQRMQERLRAGHAELRSLQQRNATLREQERETARRLQAPEARAKEAVARQEETVLQMRHAGATVWEERRRQLAEEPSMLQVGSCCDALMLLCGVRATALVCAGLIARGHCCEASDACSCSDHALVHAGSRVAVSRRGRKRVGHARADCRPALLARFRSASGAFGSPSVADAAWQSGRGGAVVSARTRAIPAARGLQCRAQSSEPGIRRRGMGPRRREVEQPAEGGRT